ncbi:hypothetical protein HWV62_42122 [Athelia sp. TMB]|nr:hypothetical protein HWV62_42122 [Athelia sp. TMB]
MLLLLSLILLESASAIVARAVSSDFTPPASRNFTSLVAPTSGNAALPGDECYDIRYCRTLGGLIQSCIVTILACVWFAVHRNIPAPKVDHPHNSFFVRVLLFVWYKILDQRQAATVFVVALLVPEWVLAWALRQFFVARRLTKKLEEARMAASQRQKTEISEGQGVEKEANDAADDGVEDEPLAEFSSVSMHSEHDRLIKRQITSQDTFDSSQHPSSDAIRQAVYNQVAVARFVGKFNEAWKIQHAFFIIMGGYYFYNKNGPCYPLSPEVVVELVRRGHLVAPTSDELANQSKGDALSKGVAILQTLWFVMQCIARRIEHLPVTSLEVMTLAYTVITVAMYIVWWDKPLNVSCAVRVPEEVIEDQDVVQYESTWEHITAYAASSQDAYVDLRKCSRVPTFWAGDRDNDNIPADGIALLVAMIFGAVHCVAWTDGFPSPLEQWLWRASAIAMIAVPPVLAVSLSLVAVIGDALSLSIRLIWIGIAIFLMPLALIYIAARLTLIVISFTSLNMLPAAAYQNVEWIAFVPHI